MGSSAAEALLALALACLLAWGLWRQGYSPAWALALAAGAAGAHLAMRECGLSLPQAATLTIFVLAYALIASDRIHMTKVALCGAAAVLGFGLVDQHTALHGSGQVPGVDWNTILLRNAQRALT